ncbi:MAG: PRC-barrel domain-containing protein [Pseudomonadota bacterium]|jgi:sporulation protein YlmC with PRC-barrel domain|nr:PRC-barrel domain-containing protein [Pseudomonadota bacterium]
MRKTLIAAGLLGSTLLATAAMAQSAPAGQQNASGFITQLGPDAMLVSDLMDQDVVGPDNKEIGEVDDVILDRNGRVIALVIEADEGIGDRTVAVPMSAIQMNAADATTTGSVQGSGQASGGSAARNSSDDMRIVLNIPAEQLKSAPEFDEDND